MDAAFDGRNLQLREVHRFPNIPVQTPANSALGCPAIVARSHTTGIAKVDDAVSIGVDSWGVDYALLGRQGELLANPVHYRDPGAPSALWNGHLSACRAARYSIEPAFNSCS